MTCWTLRAMAAVLTAERVRMAAEARTMSRPVIANDPVCLAALRDQHNQMRARLDEVMAGLVARASREVR